MITTNDGFVEITVKEQRADSIFIRDIKTDLTSNRVTVLMPPELKAKKSVVITRVDDVIYERDSADIRKEIVNKNPWIDEEVESIFKFPTS